MNWAVVKMGNQTKKKYDAYQTKHTRLDKKVLFTVLIILIFYIGCSYGKAMPREDYVGSDFCARCHVTDYNSWSQSAHYNASTSFEFETYFQEQGSPENCFSCHTTGHKENTGTSIYENIQCESCHIPVGEIEKSTYLTPCTRCHSSTQFPTHYQNEDYKKEHNHLLVECVSCHEPMGLEMKISESNVCESCHSSDSSYPVDEEHGFDYACLDCHIVFRVVDATMVTTTHFPIPQDLDLECTMCHNKVFKVHKLGEENCEKCHSPVDPALFNVGKISVNETSKLCRQCHGNVYSEWSLGIHVGNQHNKTCIDCHNPHSPYVIINETLPSVTANEECIRAQIRPQPIISPTLFFLAFLFALFLVIYYFYPIKN